MTQPTHPTHNTKKGDGEVNEKPETDAAPLAGVLVFSDGVRTVWVRASAVDAFYGLGDPVTQWRILLQSGDALIVNGTDAAKAALLAALA